MHTLHEDPSKVKEDLNPLWLLTYYGNILSIMASEDYADALNPIGMMNLTHLPSYVKYVVERFNSLLATLAERLNETERPIFCISDPRYMKEIRRGP